MQLHYILFLKFSSVSLGAVNVGHLQSHYRSQVDLHELQQGLIEVVQQTIALCNRKPLLTEGPNFNIVLYIWMMP